MSEDGKKKMDSVELTSQRENSTAVETTINGMMPIGFQWILSVIIFLTIIIWIAVGNPATGAMGYADTPVDSWLVPIIVVILAYVAAFGFFSPKWEVKQWIMEFLPLIICYGFAAFFASRSALLPFVLGTCAPSFFFILIVFNSAVSVQYNGAGIVGHNFQQYRTYIAILLCLANGIVNGIGFILEKEAGLPKGTRWIITCFAPPIVLLVPAAIKMAKGEKNGQYNVGKILFPKTTCIYKMQVKKFTNKYILFFPTGSR